MPATVLFLPGTLCDGRIWAGPLAAFAGQRACVVSDYRLADSIGAMAAGALARAEGSMIVVGLSMGGMVALEIWRQAPERVAGLALFDTDPGPDTPQRRARRDAQLLRATHGELAAMVAEDLVPSYFSATGALDPSLRSTVVEMALGQGVGAFAAQATALATRRDARPLLGHIDATALVACGAEDAICSPQSHARMASMMPRAEFVRIEGAGHLSTLEQPAASTVALRAWLERAFPMT